MSHARQGGQASDQANARRPGRCRQQQRTSPIEDTQRGRSVFGSRCHHRFTSLWPRYAGPVDPHSQSVFSAGRHQLRMHELGGTGETRSGWSRV